MLVGCVTPGTDLNITGDTLVRGCFTMIGVHNYHQDDLATAVQVQIDHLQHDHHHIVAVSGCFTLQREVQTGCQSAGRIIKI